MSINSSVSYRPCVGIMLLNHEGHVFTGRRIDTSTEAWQMPQGGIDEGEGYKKAALRELLEETGITSDKVEIISQSLGWLYYDLPEHLGGKFWGGKYKGQKQIWFLMRFLGVDGDVDINHFEPEFNEWKWIKPKVLPDLIAPFKKKIYEEVLHIFKDELRS